MGDGNRPPLRFFGVGRAVTARDCQGGEHAQENGPIGGDGHWTFERNPRAKEDNLAKRVRTTNSVSTTTSPAILRVLSTAEKQISTA